MSTPRRRDACLLALLLVVPVVRAGQAPQQPPRPPVIRTGVTMVPIDVRVVDRNGRPVTDLRQEDFAILENRLPQAIRHFSTQAFTADAAAVLTEPVFRTANTEDVAPRNRRVFLIMLGRGRHQAASKYVDALADFIERRVLPQDQIALLAWNRATDFTTDHALLKRTVLRFRQQHAGIQTHLEEWFKGLRAIYGSKEIPPHIQRQIDGVFADAAAIRPRPVPPAAISDAAQIAAETRRTADDLQRNQEISEKIAAGGHSVPDLRAEIVGDLIGQDFDRYVERMSETMQDLGNLYAGIAYLRHLEGEKHLVLITERGIRLPRRESAVALARVASDARITLDIVYTEGVVGVPPPQILPGGGVAMARWPSSGDVFAQGFAVQDLRTMTELTGGQLSAFASGEQAFRSLAEGMRFQYLLGYYSSDAARDGAFREIQVKVNRPGVQVLHRGGYFASDRLVPFDRREFVTHSRIQAASDYAGTVDHLKITLRPPSVSGASAERTLSIEVAVDISRVRFTHDGERHVATLDAALFCGDARQRVVCDTRHRVELKLTDAMREQMLKDGTSFRLSAPTSGEPRFVKIVLYDYGADLVGTAVAKVGR